MLTVSLVANDSVSNMHTSNDMGPNSSLVKSR